MLSKKIKTNSDQVQTGWGGGVADAPTSSDTAPRGASGARVRDRTPRAQRGPTASPPRSSSPSRALNPMHNKLADESRQSSSNFEGTSSQIATAIASSVAGRGGRNGARSAAEAAPGGPQGRPHAPSPPASGSTADWSMACVGRRGRAATLGLVTRPSAQRHGARQTSAAATEGDMSRKATEEARKPNHGERGQHRRDRNPAATRGRRAGSGRRRKMDGVGRDPTTGLGGWSPHDPTLSAPPRTRARTCVAP